MKKFNKCSNKPIEGSPQTSLFSEHKSTSPLRRSYAIPPNEVERMTFNVKDGNNKEIELSFTLRFSFIKEELNDCILIDVKTNNKNVIIRGNTAQNASSDSFKSTSKWSPKQLQKRNESLFKSPESTTGPFRSGSLGSTDSFKASVVFSNDSAVRQKQKQKSAVLKSTTDKSNESVNFSKHKARPIKTVFGKPRNEDYFENQLQFNKQTFKTQHSPHWSQLSENEENRKSPIRSHSMPSNIMIEQFSKPSQRLSPNRKPSLSPNRKGGIFGSETLLADQSTHNQMPELFRKAHPLVPGGGYATPPRIGAPIVPVEAYLERESNDTFAQQFVSQSASEDRFTPWFYHQMPLIFQRAHPLAPGGGIASPNRCYAPPDLSQESEEEYNSSFSQTKPEESAFTSIDYNKIPELFRRAHPLAPGGGFPTPPRSYAPPSYESEQQFISNSSQTRTKNKRLSPSISNRRSNQWQRYERENQLSTRVGSRSPSPQSVSSRNSFNTQSSPRTTRVTIEQFGRPDKEVTQESSANNTNNEVIQQKPNSALIRRSNAKSSLN